MKAVLQVGTARSDGFAAVLGYAAELVPLDNPYRLRRGGTLRVRALVDGQPVGGQVVMVGRRRSAPVSVRTDAGGIAREGLTAPGRWNIKFARMRPAAVAGLKYESLRASLTFEVR